MPTVEERIAARRHEALDHHEAEISAPAAACGRAIGGPAAAAIVLTVEEAAQIAAATLHPDTGPRDRRDSVIAVGGGAVVRVSPAGDAVFERAAIAFTGTAAGAAANAGHGRVRRGTTRSGAGLVLGSSPGPAGRFLDALPASPRRRRVLPAQGVGRRLTTAFLTEGRHLGARTLFLTTGQANTAARRGHGGPGRPRAGGDHRTRLGPAW